MRKRAGSGHRSRLSRYKKMVHRPAIKSVCVWCVAAAAGLCAVDAPGATARAATMRARQTEGVSVVVLDRDLKAHPAIWMGMRDGALQLVDAQRGQVSVGGAEALAVVEADWWNPEPGSNAPTAAMPEGGGLTGGGERSPRGVLELTDGTRLTGLLAARDAENADLVAWTHPALGRMVFPLDSVSRIDFGTELAGGAEMNRDGAESAARATEGAARAASAQGDVVELLNGDRLSGFVERLGSQIVVRTGTGANSAASSPEASVVRSVRMANPATGAKGLFVWLLGGNTLGASELQAGGPDSVRMVFAPAEGLSRQVNVRLDQYRAIVPRAERLVALATLPLAIERPAPDRLAAGALRVNRRADDLLRAADVAMSGPGVVEWVLPAGARRIAGWLVLPAAAREWGDCAVRVSEVRGETARVLREARVNGERPWMALGESLEGGEGARLRVEVESGARGPIQDRIVLRRVLIAVGE